MKFTRDILLLMPILVIMGCSKDGNNSLSGGTSLTLVDVVVGSNNLVTNFNGPSGTKVADSLRYYGTASEIQYSSYMEFSGYIGSTYLSLSPITDTSITLWSGMLNLPINSINSLFLAGADSLHIDTLFTTDHPIPHIVSDSNVGIRFVNLSPGSNAVSVDIQGNAPGSINAGLPYKGITPFADYPVTAETPSDYFFEFRDAATGTLLAQFDMGNLNSDVNGNTNGNQYRWRNVTICLYGLPNAQQTMLVNNY